MKCNIVISVSRGSVYVLNFSLFLLLAISVIYAQTEIQISDTLFYVYTGSLIKVTAETVNIRTGPVTSADVIAKAKHDDIFIVNSTDPGTYQTCTTQGICWWRIHFPEANEAWIATSVNSTQVAQYIRTGEISRTELSSEQSRKIVSLLPDEITLSARNVMMFMYYIVAVDSEDRMIAGWLWDQSPESSNTSESIEGHWVIRRTCEQIGVQELEVNDQLEEPYDITYDPSRDTIILNGIQVPVLEQSLRINNRSQTLKPGLIQNTSYYRAGDFDTGIVALSSTHDASSLN